MDKQSEKYLDDLITYEAFATDVKYRKGDEEHGGHGVHLWEMPGMLKNIEQENTDQKTYVFTLRYQMRVMRKYQLAGEYDKALAIMNLILAEPSDDPIVDKLIADYSETWKSLKDK